MLMRNGMARYEKMKRDMYISDLRNIGITHDKNGKSIDDLTYAEALQLLSTERYIQAQEEF